MNHVTISVVKRPDDRFDVCLNSETVAHNLNQVLANHTSVGLRKVFEALNFVLVDKTEMPTGASSFKYAPLALAQSAGSESSHDEKTIPSAPGNCV